MKRLLHHALSRLLDCALHVPADGWCECDQPDKPGMHDRDRCWQFDPDVPEPVAPLHSPTWRGGAS